MKTYKGMTKTEIIAKIVAAQIVEFTKKNNEKGKYIFNTDARDLTALYTTYPMTSKKYPAFSLAGIYDEYCG